MRPVKPVLLALGAIMLGIGCLSCGGPAISSSKLLPTGGGASAAASNGAANHGAANSKAPAAGASTTMCQPYQATNVDGGTYTVQDDEWGSSAAQCVSTKGKAAFTVTKSAISEPAGGNPGSYPSIYAGCNWGDCTQGGLAARPQLLSGLRSGAVTTTLATTDPAGGAYDVSYDIWVNRTATTSGAPNGLEIMVWLNSHGGVQPAGSEVATGVQIGGYTYDVWYSPNAGNGPCVTYEMTTGRTEVTNLDLVPLLANAEQHGDLNSSWYLIAVEAGFEIWQGGAGLAVRHFSVALG